MCELYFPAKVEQVKWNRHKTWSPLEIPRSQSFLNLTRLSQVNKASLRASSSLGQAFLIKKGIYQPKFPLFLLR